MITAISVLCAIIAIITYGAWKTNRAREKITSDIKISLKPISVLLMLLCLILSGLCLHFKNRADILNDALYIANRETQIERMEKVETLKVIEEYKREIEHLKRDLEGEREGKAALAEYHDRYVQEAETYINELELDQIYNTRYYYHYR